MSLRQLPALLLLVGASAACAGGGAPAVAPAISAEPDRAVFGTGTSLTTTPDEAAVSWSVPGDPNQAMRALVAGYEELGIEVTLIDPPNRRLGNPRFVASRTIAGEPLTSIVSCGETMTSARAARDRIYLSLTSTVTPGASGLNRVVSRLEAVAVDHQSGTSGNTVPCRTTGLLEGRLHKAAVLKLVP